MCSSKSITLGRNNDDENNDDDDDIVTPDHNENHTTGESQWRRVEVWQESHPTFHHSAFFPRSLKHPTTIWLHDDFMTPVIPQAH